MNIKNRLSKKKRFLINELFVLPIFAFCILPDGQVTICEEQYWQPNFIIENILTNTIDEIWQSKKH
jgi:hypothetical protein